MFFGNLIDPWLVNDVESLSLGYDKRPRIRGLFLGYRNRFRRLECLLEI